MTVTVTDSGRGMDEATLARIFQPFFTTKARGMGLGLSISRTIVAAHGGTLTVQSAAGEGTTFRLELPVGAPDAARPAQPVTAAAGSGGTVFVIDDDPSLRRAVERQLQGAGYIVETFASAQAFLDRTPPTGVACIVSDVRMPGLSGLDLQATLARAGRELPTVFVSGHGDVPTSVQAMRAGAVTFLAKPFGKDELAAAVGEALARSRGRERTRRENAELQARYRSLTPREREVLALVSAGLLNKVIADRLGAAEKTVKIHRGRVMEKMSASSVADLVRMVERLGLQAGAGIHARLACLRPVGPRSHRHEGSFIHPPCRRRRSRIGSGIERFRAAVRTRPEPRPCARHSHCAQPPRRGRLQDPRRRDGRSRPRHRPRP